MNSYFRWNHIRILVNFMVHRGSTCYVWALIRIIKPLAGVSPNVFNRQNNLNISRITTANGRFMNRDFHSFTSCKLQSLHDTTSIFYVDAKKTKIILSLFAKNVMSNRSLGYIDISRDSLCKRYNNMCSYIRYYSLSLQILTRATLKTNGSCDRHCSRSKRASNSRLRCCLAAPSVESPKTRKREKERSSGLSDLGNKEKVGYRGES